jgi:bifunctional pyridoxal-dependent enzyme with beta-cystathionase and maltose regulon repressor activities
MLIEKYNKILISDEIYSDLTYQNNTHIVASTVGD